MMIMMILMIIMYTDPEELEEVSIQEVSVEVREVEVSDVKDKIEIREDYNNLRINE